MEITENTFIEALGLPEWDDRILELLEYLEMERPYVTADEFGCERSCEKYGIDFYFAINVESGTEDKREDDGALYLEQIVWKKNTTLAMPFGINYEDDCRTIVKKVGRPSDVPIEFIDNDCGWGNYEKPYWMQCNFACDERKELTKIFIRLQQPYDFTKEW